MHKTMPLVYHAIGFDSVVINAGCTSAMACNLAILMGCSPIFLCGVDLCYFPGQTRFTDRTYNASGSSWSWGTSSQIPPDKELITTDGSLESTTEFMSYKMGFMYSWCGVGADFVVLGKNNRYGALQEFPYMDVDCFNPHPKLPTHKQRVARANKYYRKIPDHPEIHLRRQKK